ncbi:efflux transporter outer membrane subunit [uncultured Sphingomonas sp.]|uniref:efflux transporter outer membrane subunit n=1 Tax=uncultured Sphingomonas sp. TaxID=158754 RepID=UPI002618DAEE|nr:efflux transporter outer membrane subunit [uncultured Sphingomonas sp.]
MARRGVGSVAFAALACVVGGCSMAPAYHPPTLPAPAHFKEDATWKAADPAIALPAQWWTLLGDPQLDKLEERVATGNPTLAIALARYDRARAELREAKSGLMPQIGLSTNLTSNRQSEHRPLRGSNQPDFYGADTVGGAISFDPDLWGRVRGSVAAGKAEMEASGDMLAAARLSLQAQLAFDYVRLRGQDRQLTLLAQSVDGFRQADALVERRFRGGIASGVDTARAGSLLEGARAEVEELRSARALTEHAIASLTGTPASDFTLAPADTRFRIAAIPPGLPSTLLERRPDVAAAEREVAAANAGIGVAKAAFFPSIMLGGAGGFQSTALAGLISAPNLFWSIGPGAILNLFEGGRRHARLAEANANWAEATARYRALVLQAFQDVEDQLALLDRLGAAQRNEDKAADDAEQAQRIALNRYVKGAATYLDVVTAQTTALTLRQQAISLETRRGQAQVGLMRALGGGWGGAAKNIAG